MRLLAVLSFAAFVLFADSAEAAACKTKRGRPQVKVLSKTPMRRGPGLNYAVASFLERSKCAPFSEVSLDERWVLVEVDRRFGWVPVSRLAKSSRKKVRRSATTGPVGSGQARGTAQVIRQSVMNERPDPKSPVRRVLPEGLQVLPLALTRDGRWIQVRDERGDIGWTVASNVVGDSLAQLPRTELRAPPESARDRPEGPRLRRRGRKVVAAGPGGGASETSEVREAPVLKDDGGFKLRLAVFGAALNPLHSLDSNGVAAVRRYDLTALSPGAALEVEALNVGPMNLRAGYTIAFMSGVDTDDFPNLGTAAGMQHDAYLRVGLPVMLGGILLTPEVGYHFGFFDFDSLLAGQNLIVFLSTQSHTGSAGLRMQAALSEDVIIDADASALVGITEESPRELGDSGLTLGVAGQLGLRWMLSDAYSLIARYTVNYRTTSFSGAAQLDSTITEATLVDLSHGLLAGLAIDL